MPASPGPNAAFGFAPYRLSVSVKAGLVSDLTKVVYKRVQAKPEEMGQVTSPGVWQSAFPDASRSCLTHGALLITVPTVRAVSTSERRGGDPIVIVGSVCGDQCTEGVSSSGDDLWGEIKGEVFTVTTIEEVIGLEPAAIRCPFPAYSELRDSSPVVYSEAGGFFVVVSRQGRAGSRTKHVVVLEQVPDGSRSDRLGAIDSRDACR